MNIHDLIGRQAAFAQFGADATLDPSAAALAAFAAGGGNPWAGGGGYDPNCNLGFGLSCPPDINFQMLRMMRGQCRPAGPPRVRRELLGFPRTTIAAGDTDTISTQPQVLVKVLRIVIPSDIAFQLLVHDFKIGKWSLLANNDPVPAAMLDELAEETNLDPDIAPVNTVISATLENTSNADVDVRMGAQVDAIEC